MTMEWTKHAKKKVVSVNAKKERRLTITVTEQLEKAIVFFKKQYDDVEFTDTAVLATFIEAGLRSFVGELAAAQANAASRADRQHTTNLTPVPSDD